MLGAASITTNFAELVECATPKLWSGSGASIASYCGPDGWHGGGVSHLTGDELVLLT